MTSRIDQIREKLTKALKPTNLEIIDESHLHVGHAGAASGAGHYKIIVHSHLFTDKSAVARHQLVYAALSDMMQTDIHALSIQAITPESDATQ